MLLAWSLDAATEWRAGYGQMESPWSLVVGCPELGRLVPPIATRPCSGRQCSVARYNCSALRRAAGRAGRNAHHAKMCVSSVACVHVADTRWRHQVPFFVTPPQRHAVTLVAGNMDVSDSCWGMDFAWAVALPDLSL